MFKKVLPKVCVSVGMCLVLAWMEHITIFMKKASPSCNVISNRIESD